MTIATLGFSAIVFGLLYLLSSVYSLLDRSEELALLLNSHHCLDHVLCGILRRFSLQHRLLLIVSSLPQLDDVPFVFSLGLTNCIHVNVGVGGRLSDLAAVMLYKVGTLFENPTLRVNMIKDRW